VRRLASVLWVVSIGVVCYLSLQPEVEFPLDFERADLAYHSLTYLWLSFLPFVIFGDGKRRLLAAFLMIPLGVLLEIGQSFVPGRTFSILDMVANSCGTLLAVGCGRYLHVAISKMMRY
jgi:VanZ family protein